MGQVQVTFQGKQFRLACDDGEEGHLKRLADDFTARIDDLKSKFGEIGETRLTLMAALTYADELEETRRRLRALEDETAGLKDSRRQSIDRDRAKDDAMAAALNEAAERIEAAAKRLAPPATVTVPMG